MRCIAKIKYLFSSFNLTASLIAYLSVVILMIRKKEKNIAVEYLCGANKRQSVLTLILACCSISFIPVVAVSVMIIVVPEIQWLDRSAFLTEIITPDLIWIAVICFAFTIVISVIAVLMSVGRRSPLTYLRGLE